MLKESNIIANVTKRVFSESRTGHIWLYWSVWLDYVLRYSLFSHFHCIFTSYPLLPYNMLFVCLNHFKFPLHKFSNRLILLFKTKPNPLIMRSGQRSELRMPLHMAGQIRVSPAVWISNSAAAGLHLYPELQLNTSRCASRSARPYGAHTKRLQLAEQHGTSMQTT